MADETQFDDADFVAKLRDTSLRSATLQLRLLQELKQRLASLPAGTIGYTTPCVMPTLNPRAGDYFFDLARLSAQVSLTAYEQWLTLSERHFGYIVDSLTALLPKPKSDSRPPAQLTLAAVRHGDRRVSARLIIENPCPTSEEVFFTKAVFRSAGRTTPVHANITAARLPSPETGAGLRLEPAQSGRFELTFEADEPFTTGSRYLGEAYVLVGGAVVGRLSIEVDSGDAVAAPAPSPAPGRRRTRRDAHK